MKSGLLYFTNKPSLSFILNKEHLFYATTLQHGSYRSFMTTRLLNSSVLPFSAPRIHSSKRIGPHNYEILCILIGSLLGDGCMEKSVDGYRFVFYQKGEHIEYLIWLHKQLFKHGYCKENLPQIKSRKGLSEDNGKLVYYCRFRSFTYSSFS